MKKLEKETNLFKNFLIADICKQGFIEETLKDDFDKLTPQVKKKLKTYISFDENGVSIKPWIKSRLFETLLFSKGLDDYLQNLMTHEGPNPEKNVQMNNFLASSLAISSLNAFIYELITDVSNRKTGIAIEHKKAILNLLKPNRDFTINPAEVFFSPDQIETIRDELLRKSLDVLSFYDNREKIPKLGAPKIEKKIEIPFDLVKIGVFESKISVSQLISFTKKFKSLKIRVSQGYLIWSFSNKPTIYINQGRAYFSPKFSSPNKRTTRKKAEAQLYVIVEKLESGIKRPTVECGICKKLYTNTIMFHAQKGAIPVCSRCSKDPSVVGVISKLDAKEEQTTLV